MFKVSGKLGWFGKFMLGLNILCILLLALSHLSVHISPARSWVLPFFGLIYPYLVLVNFFFIAWWLVKMKWLFILSLIMLLSGWDHFGRTFRLNAPDENPPGNNTFKVLSYNVKNLSNDNVNLSDKSIRTGIIHYLLDAAPDLLCLQEFLIIHTSPEIFIDSLSGAFGLPYYAFAQYNERYRNRFDAIHIFSRFPIIYSSEIKIEEKQNTGVFADLLIDQDTFRLMNVHLESVRLRHEDYRFLAELDFQSEDNPGIKEGSRVIMRKLKRAYAKRAMQVDHLADMIRKSPYPVILCGDFNDTPTSYAYQQLMVELTDAFRESGHGFGNTYVGKLPSFRIDYILYDNIFMSSAFRRDLVTLSDHYPISCLLNKREP